MMSRHQNLSQVFQQQEQPFGSRGGGGLLHQDDALLSAVDERASGLQFPWKLHVLFEQVEKRGHSHIISWLPDGKSFKVHDRYAFTNQIMPIFFGSSKYKTFQRNLNLWGFQTVSKGPYKGVCSHEFFVRGMPTLCSSMKRVCIKGGDTSNNNNRPSKNKKCSPRDDDDDDQDDAKEAFSCSSEEDEEEETPQQQPGKVIRKQVQQHSQEQRKSDGPHHSATQRMSEPAHQSTASFPASQSNNLQILNGIAAQNHFLLAAATLQLLPITRAAQQSMAQSANLLALEQERKDPIARLTLRNRQLEQELSRLATNYGQQQVQVQETTRRNQPCLETTTTSLQHLQPPSAAGFKLWPCQARRMPMDHNRQVNNISIILKV
jgi:hypothetical protein